jgi:hypothetical protein
MYDPTIGKRWPFTDKSMFDLSGLMQCVTACDEGVFISHKDWEVLVNKIEIINYYSHGGQYDQVTTAADFLYEIHSYLALE